MGCFVNFVTEVSYDFTFPSEILELSFQHLSHSISLDTWTVHSVENLNFFIPDDESNIVNWDTGYLRYLGRHHSVTNCLCFLLMTVSFNETLSAMHRSGYGRSSNVLFFIHVDDNQDFKYHSGLLIDFQDFSRSAVSSGLNLTSAELTFHAGIIFINVHFEYGLLYCNFCPGEMGKFHKIHWNADTPAWSIVNAGESLSIKLNEVTGYNQLQILIFVVKAKEAKQELSNLFGTMSSRESYSSLMNDPVISAPPEFPAILAKMNVTKWTIRNLAEIKTDDESGPDDRFWSLNIAWGEVTVLEMHNNFLTNHDNFLALPVQKKIFGYYCVDKDIIQVVSWDLFVHIFDIPTWSTLAISMLIYKKLHPGTTITTGLDLAWLMFGFQCWKKHPRKLIWAYLISILFLACTVQSGVSNEFVTFTDRPNTVIGLIREKYKVVVTDVIYGLAQRVAAFLEQRGVLASLRKPFIRAVGNISIEEGTKHVFPVSSQLLASVELVRIMVKHRVLRVLTQPEDPVAAIMNAVDGTDTAVLIQDKFWCRTTLPDDFSEARGSAHSLHIWHFLAVRGFRLFSMYQAGGFPVREDKLKLHYILSQRKVTWKFVGEETEPKGIKLNSPMGFALVGVLAANLIGCLILSTRLGLAHNVVMRLGKRKYARGCKNLCRNKKCWKFHVKHVDLVKGGNVESPRVSVYNIVN